MMITCKKCREPKPLAAFAPRGNDRHEICFGCQSGYDAGSLSSLMPPRRNRKIRTSMDAPFDPMLNPTYIKEIYEYDLLPGAYLSREPKTKGRVIKGLSEANRFLNLIDIPLLPDGSPDPHRCWLWKSGKQGEYPNFKTIALGKNEHCNRIMYKDRVGAISHDMDIAHLCHNTPCVNPFHLKQCTRAENLAMNEGRLDLPDRDAKLDPNTLIMLELHEQGLSNTEIGRRLGIKRGNVSQRLYNHRKRQKKKSMDECPLPFFQYS